MSTESAAEARTLSRVGSAALVGASCGAIVVARGLDGAPLLRLATVVAVASAVGVLLCLLVASAVVDATTEAGWSTHGTTPARRAAAQSWPSAAPVEPPARPAVPMLRSTAAVGGPAGSHTARPAATARTVAPVGTSQAVPTGPQWWQATSTDHLQDLAPVHEVARPGTAADELSPASWPDLPAPTTPVRVVQCPRCGDFAVDQEQQRIGYAFRCRGCRHPWRWQPGAAWPVTVVRPRLARHEPTAPSRRPG